MSEREKRLAMCVEQMAQVLNSAAPGISMLKSVADKNEHYDRNTIVSGRSGQTVNDYINVLYENISKLVELNSEAMFGKK